MRAEEARGTFGLSLKVQPIRINELRVLAVDAVLFFRREHWRMSAALRLIIAKPKVSLKNKRLRFCAWSDIYAAS